MPDKRQTLEYYVETAREVAIIAVDKTAKLRIRNVVANISRIVMVRDIKRFQGQTHSIFFCDLKIFRDLGVNREKVWKSLVISISYADKTLGFTDN